MVAETLLVGYCPTLEAGKHLVKKKKKKKKKDDSQIWRKRLQIINGLDYKHLFCIYC